MVTSNVVEVRNSPRNLLVVPTCEPRLVLYDVVLDFVGRAGVGPGQPHRGRTDVGDSEVRRWMGKG